ncbi:MAG: beta-galactosidase [Bacteroidota bacterium]|nr:beta-galactosidase [Bacteroidota bacterium]
MNKLYYIIIIVLISFGCRQDKNPEQKTGKERGTGLTSEVRIHNSMPSLYINGKLTSQILGAPYRLGESHFRDFLDAGIMIYNIYLRFDWTGPEEYDFSRIDEKMDLYLSTEPDALFIPRILLTPGEWWCEKYPDEITMRDDGSPAGMFGQACHPSLASEVYRDLSYKAMKAFIEHVESRYGDNIIGYQPGNGFGGEWLMFNSFWEARPDRPAPDKFGVEDYSPPARKGFREWLKNKYVTVDALRDAWCDKRVNFENAEPPDEIQRYSSNHGIFFDPAQGRQVPDYFSFFNDMTADVLIENCKWVKELTNNRKIVGSFYGYLWCNFPNLSVNHTGHLGFEKVLNSSYVDFIASPYTYDNKQIGGPNNSQTLPENCLLHGKLYFNEVDTETHLHQRQWRWGNSLHNPTDWEETKALLIRDYGYAMTKGLGMWWTDLHGGNFHDEKITGLIRKLKNIDKRYLDADKTSTADIAVILDEETYKYFGDGEPLFNALLTAQKQWELGFIGAPWEPYLLTDIDEPGLKDFKVYLFLNTFHVTPTQKEKIHKKLERNNATAIWVYAPGYIRDDSLSIDAMSDLTGISLKGDNSTGELRVELTDYSHAYTKSLPYDFAYGTDVNVEEIIRWYDHQIYLKDPRNPKLERDLPGFRIAPRFFSIDEDADVLGMLAEVNRPGLVVKKQEEGWTSVYSGAPIIPASLLRNIIRESGGHIYSDGNDVVYANKSSLCIYSPDGGERTITLPDRMLAIDLIENRVLINNGDEFTLDLEANTSVLIGLYPPSLPDDVTLTSHYSQDDRDFLAWKPTFAWNPHHPEVFGIMELVK